MSVEAPLSISPRSVEAVDRRARFISQALPLRADLERAARRYTRNFHDAQDLVSETYVKAWAGFDTFQDGTNLRAWMYRILMNAWIDAHRRAESRPREALTDAFTDSQLGAHAARCDAAPSAEERNVRGMLSAPVFEAMQRLPEAQQAILFYVDVCALPYKKTAEITGLPLGTVMSRTHRARNQLRNALVQIYGSSSVHARTA